MALVVAVLIAVVSLLSDEDDWLGLLLSAAGLARWHALRLALRLAGLKLRDSTMDLRAQLRPVGRSSGKSFDRRGCCKSSGTGCCSWIGRNYLVGR